MNALQTLSPIEQQEVFHKDTELEAIAEQLSTLFKAIKSKPARPLTELTKLARQGNDTLRVLPDACFVASEPQTFNDPLQSIMPEC